MPTRTNTISWYLPNSPISLNSSSVFWSDEFFILCLFRSVYLVWFLLRYFLKILFLCLFAAEVLYLVLVFYTMIIRSSIVKHRKRERVLKLNVDLIDKFNRDHNFVMIWSILILNNYFLEKNKQKWIKYSLWRRIWENRKKKLFDSSYHLLFILKLKKFSIVEFKKKFFFYFILKKMSIFSISFEMFTKNIFEVLRLNKINNLWQLMWFHIVVYLWWFEIELIIQNWNFFIFLKYKLELCSS